MEKLNMLNKNQKKMDKILSKIKKLSIKYNKLAGKNEKLSNNPLWNIHNIFN